MQQLLRQSSFNLIEFVGCIVIFSNIFNWFSKYVVLSHCSINHVLLYGY